MGEFLWFRSPHWLCGCVFQSIVYHLEFEDAVQLCWLCRLHRQETHPLPTPKATPSPETKEKQRENINRGKSLQNTRSRRLWKKFRSGLRRCRNNFRMWGVVTGGIISEVRRIEPVLPKTTWRGWTEHQCSHH